MTSFLKLHPYREGDEVHILKLFRESFGREMDAKYWAWRYRDNPVGKIMVELAWDGDRLAGHYAVSPVVVTVNGTDCLTALSMTTMTHPEYRGKGLFPALASQLYSRMRDEGYLMVWGFPNNQSHRGFARDLDWKDVHEIPYLRLDLANLSGRLRPIGNVFSMETIDQRVDEILKSAQNPGDVSVKRYGEYLRWRYSANPSNVYRVLGCSGGNQLLGYIVFKRFEETMDVVDMLEVRGSGALRDLIHAVVETCREEGLRTLNLWFPLHDPFHLDLEKIGFVNAGPSTYLGGRVLREMQGEKDLFDVRRWYYTMGDSDVY